MERACACGVACTPRLGTRRPDGLASYFDLITACSVLVTIGAFFQFRERPLLPPSSSAAAKILEDANADPNKEVGRHPPTQLPTQLPT